MHGEKVHKIQNWDSETTSCRKVTLFIWKSVELKRVTCGHCLNKETK